MKKVFYLVQLIRMFDCARGGRRNLVCFIAATCFGSSAPIFSQTNLYQAGVGFRQGLMGVNFQNQIDTYTRWSVGYFHGLDQSSAIDLDWLFFLKNPGLLQGGSASALTLAGASGGRSAVGMAWSSLGLYTGLGLEGVIEKKDETKEFLHPKIPLGLEIRWNSRPERWHGYLQTDILWQPENKWAQSWRPMIGAKLAF